MASIVAYLRVSTKRQGESGLGLEAQRTAVEAHAAAIGGRVVQWYVEVETGKRADRPELQRALAHAKRSKATLCVAKLDRLSRNVRFLATVMDSGCEFAAADMPAANRFMLHVMAAVAEHEAKAISERTKAALQAAKARGTLLGAARPGSRALTPAATAKGRAKAAEVRSAAAQDAYRDIVPTMNELRAGGASLHDIAARLNEQQHTTRHGRPWNAMQVSRVLNRAS
jgi:DNA invertase Pin-like site-specific DNA recombinase